MEKIIIVGASGGVGSAVARRLGAKGAALHLIGRDEPKIAALAQELDASFACAEVTDEAALSAAVQQAGEAKGLVYAVGNLNLKPLQSITVALMEQDFRVNVLGALVSVKAALPALKRAGGAIVLFSSIAARRGFPFHASIGASKAAVEGLTLALAAELAPKIRVNAIAPSLMRTQLAARIVANEATAATIAAAHPISRLGEAGDAAGLAEFLLSADAQWISGQIFACDGGRSTLNTRN
jgi:NAD(P)-dependent dehydrogenase (short-subunit alcohol dehydrogenase family)